MKKVLSLLVLALLGTNILWARDFFSATSPSGHTLYYLIEGGVAHVTHPRGDSYFNKRFENPWNGKGPTGALEIPARVTYNGNNYSVVSIGLQAFYQCSGLTSVTIPNSVTSIGDEAFEYCIGLTSVTIPNSVTSIGDGAFSNCSGLTSVTIPSSATTIGARAFKECGVTSLTIPATVETIGNEAFAYCYNLNTLYFNATNCTYPSYYEFGMFAYDTMLTNVVFGENITNTTDNIMNQIKSAFNNMRIATDNTMAQPLMNLTYDLTYYGSITTLITVAVTILYFVLFQYTLLQLFSVSYCHWLPLIQQLILQ